MIERYTIQEMADIWDESSKFKNWIKVERAAVLALSKDKTIENIDSILTCMQSHSDNPFPIMQLSKEKEKETRHDVAAFVDVLADQVEHEVGGGKWIHFGLTSSDVVDTAFSMQMVEALDLILDKVTDLEDVLLDMAHKYKCTAIMGRTHGMHAEPTTFGLIILNYYMEFLRHIDRLHESIDIMKVGKLSGAVGTLSHLSLDSEAAALKELGLRPAKTSNQILQRDRHAEVFNTLALLASSIEKLAIQIRSMQRTEIGEVQESFSKGQKGSSSMPHKKNPILSENLCGLARLVRGYAQSAMEDIALWHERDISHSSVERVIAPDSFCLVHFMLDRIEKIMRNLVVNKYAMFENICKNGNRWASQTIMLKLVEAGFSRKDAYSLVQSAAMQHGDFLMNMKRKMIDAKMGYHNACKIIDEVSIENHLRNIDKIFERALND